MKKVFVTFACILMSLALSACGLFVSRTGKTAFEEGKLAVAAGDYNAAIGYFELAQSEGNKSQELKDLISAISTYVDAVEDYDAGEYEEAKTAVESIVINEATQGMMEDVNRLKRDIQTGIESRSEIDEHIADAERLFANGDYATVGVRIKEIENNEDLSKAQEEKVDLLKQQLETANMKVASASTAAYASEYDRENARLAVSNFVYAYESFVKSGQRSSDAYYSYMASYSPSWSNAYKNQWNYFWKHNITSYYVSNLTFDSVTYDGNAFYVIDNESIGETKNGKYVSSTAKWRYTVIKDGGSFKVTNYSKVK